MSRSGATNPRRARHGVAWLGALSLLALPILTLVSFGGWFLWERGWHWYGLAGALGSAGLSWLWISRLRRRIRVDSLNIQEDPSWTRKGQSAWRQVERTARAARRHPEWLTDAQALQRLALRVIQKVAREFHGDARNAAWELSAPEFLRTVELALAELRVDLSRNIPGSHLLTVQEVLQVRELVSMGDRIYDLYRLLSFGLSPHAALLREVRDYMVQRIGASTREELQGWLLETLVRRFGFYAIELYSGRIALEDEALQAHLTAPSKQQLHQIQQRQSHLDAEPLRVLVIGQTGSGKTSLVNALFGKLRTVDRAGETKKSDWITPHLLEHEGQERALLLDSVGYGHPETHPRVLKALEEAVAESDLLLLACSATEAGRGLDRQVLEQLRKRVQEQQDLDLLPILVAVTHVDQLRPFREWRPPYNVAEPESLKARNIRGAMEAVAADLELDLSQTVPVCLRPGWVDNVEEGLLPAIWEQMDDALRRKYVRCLLDYREQRDWSLMWEQAVAAGRFVARSGLRQLGQTLKKVEEKAPQWMRERS